MLKGTAFFIGEEGIAVTAAHVVEHLSEDENGNVHEDARPVGAFVNEDGKWEMVDILSYESHMSEDVALLRMDGVFRSMFVVSPSFENSSKDYSLWGYPEKVAHETRLLATNAVDARTLVRPDLIYSRGYIRRRISRPLHSSLYRGEAFYELSAVAGSCCSGAPVIAFPHMPRQPFEVIGVYIGEETAGQPPVGYATRFDALGAWLPEMTGRRLLKTLPALK